ncbi:hypothetical protein [Acetobacter sp. LMG 32666]|uniref:hypothetical protein n=1 Tax=Acetobacter sp. LMG 32666 TaxID=2959295 RepID=UPI0030C7E927
MGDIFALDQLQRINRTLSRGSVPAADYREAMEKISFLEQNCTILTINRDEFKKFSYRVNDKLTAAKARIAELEAEKEAREKAWKAHYGKLIADYNKLSDKFNKENAEKNEVIDDFNQKVSEKNIIIRKYNALLEKYNKLAKAQGA